MGLIKTAIMTAGGVYAVKQIARTAETRQSGSGNRDNNYPQDRGYYAPNNYGPPGPPPRPDQQQQWNGNPGSYGNGARGYDDYDNNYDAKYVEQDSYAYQQRRQQYGPPPEQDGYQYQQRRQVGPPPSYAPQGYAPGPSQGPDGSSMAGLAGMAMDFVGGDGKKGKMDKLSGFLGK